MPALLARLFKRPVQLTAMMLVAALMFVASTAMAWSRSAVGYWKTIDDETGEAKSIVKIYEVDGKYYGRVDRLLLKPGALCEKCEGEDHNAPIEGMVVMWGLNADGDGEYSGGKIFDPEKNKTYRCAIWLKDGKLMVRGYLGPFFRTQTWHPVER